MPPQVQQTWCRVTIQPPSIGAPAFGPQELARSLLGVETDKDLTRACGSFTLVMLADVDASGRRWDQRIPRRSLVRIEMARPGATHLEGDPLVMVGLTDDQSVQEDYSDARPRRVVRIQGREVSCILVDAMLWYHARLAFDPRAGTLVVKTMLGEQRVALSQNPHLARVMEDPRVILKRILDYYVFVGGEALEGPTSAKGGMVQAPVIGLDMPVPLKELLDVNDAAWNTFEPVFVPIPQHPVTAGSVWNYLHLYIDRMFQEFFTRVEDGRCKIHFRGKPFRHDLNHVTTGSRFKTSTQEPTLRTHRLVPEDLVAQSVAVQTAQVYNVFLVLPMGMSDQKIDPNFRDKVMPQIITDAAHPSFVGRYGLRVLEVETRYLSPLLVGSQAGGGPQIAPHRPPADPVRAANYAHLANQLAYEEGIPAALRPWFVSMIKNESAFDPTAHGPVLKSADGSIKQAEGIAQWVQPYPDGVGLTNPFDPENALRAAARYWQQMRAMAWIGDDPRLLVAGYNAGPGAVRTYHGIPPFQETQRQVRKVEADVPLFTGLAGLPEGAKAAPPPDQTPGQAALAQQDTQVVFLAQKWAAILRCWYDMGGELFSGLLTVRGHPAWNIGDRIFGRDVRGPWEAYIEGVRHSYEMRTGQYLTHLRITRGWYLNAAIIQQLYAEGQTGVVATEGGPPAVSPTTGTPEKGTGSVEVILHLDGPAEGPPL
jgi:hypothetical protein